MLALLLLASPGCEKLSTAVPCETLGLQECLADAVHCEAVTRCAGGAACVDPAVCGLRCEPLRPAGVCVRVPDRTGLPATCQPGVLDAGFDCERVDPPGCEPATLASGPDRAAREQRCRDFTCRKIPDACADCSTALVRCVRRPTPLFGR